MYLQSHPNCGRLRRWQLLQQMSQHFWKRWTTQYLHTLQQRPQARSTTAKVKIDDIILIREDILPPTQWMLGRIVETHPDDDDIIIEPSLSGSGTAQSPLTQNICTITALLLVMRAKMYEKFLESPVVSHLP
jgi:Family of unknown function (DUF5641)